MPLFDQLGISKLVTIGDELYLNELPLIKNIYFPALTVVTSFLTIDTLELVTTISFERLQQAGALQVLSNGGLIEVLFPLLKSVSGNLYVSSCEEIRTLNFDSLTSFGFGILAQLYELTVINLENVITVDEIKIAVSLFHI